MPRAYNLDPRDKRYKKYDANTLEKAVEEYNAGGTFISGSCQ